MVSRPGSDPPRFAPAERPRIAISHDGTVAAIGESTRIVVVALPSAAGIAEIGTDPEAASTDLAWVGPPARLVVLSRYAAYSVVHLLDPFGPRSIAEIRLEAPMRLFSSVGAHALAVGAQGSAVLTAGEAHLTPYQFPARGVPLAAGSAAGQFLVALPGAIEEWDPQARMPKRRLRLPRPAVITALGGSERVVWMTTQQEPSRVDVIALVTRGQPKAHDLPEPIAYASGHPRSDLVLCLGAHSHRLYVVDLDGRKRLRVIGLPGIDRIEAAGLVVGASIAALGAQAQRPLGLSTLEEGMAGAEAALASAAAFARTMAAMPADEDEAPRKPSTLSEPDFSPEAGPPPAAGAAVSGLAAAFAPRRAEAMEAAPAGSGASPAAPAGPPAGSGAPLAPIADVPAGSGAPPAPIEGSPATSGALAVPAGAPAGSGASAAPSSSGSPPPAAAVPTAASQPSVSTPAQVPLSPPVVWPVSAPAAPAAPAAPTRPQTAAAAGLSSAPLGFTAVGASASPARQAAVGAPVAAPLGFAAATDAARWRDDVVAWARAVAAGVEREPPPAPPAEAIAARFELPPVARRALILLYGAHLCGEAGAAPVDVARVCDRSWDEALGRGRLAEARLATYERSRVRLAAPIQRALDELPPATGLLFGTPGAPALLAPWAAVAPGEPLPALAARLAAQIGGAILASHPDADPLELLVESRARGAVPLLRLAPGAAPPLLAEPAILVVDDEAAAERIGAPVL